MGDEKEVGSICDWIFIVPVYVHGKDLRRSGLDVVVAAWASKDLRAILSIMSSFWARF